MRWVLGLALVVAIGVSASAAEPMDHVASGGANATVPARRGLMTVAVPTLGTCSAQVHDRYVATGPDGAVYRTWHPQVVPVDFAEPGGPTCTFAHEHGDDPSTSLADPTPPLFDYAARRHGMEEAHEGFKVFVINRGTTNDEGRTATTSTRIVAHMGTGGAKRFIERFHTLEFDLVAPDGHEVHVLGMADTANAGSICDRDAALATPTSVDDVGRSIVVVPGVGCDADGSLYEIWQFTLNVGRATVVASTAVFDPITVLDPNDPGQAVLTMSAYPEFGMVFGCDREAYHGPVYWYDKNGPTTFWTDAMGARVPAGTPGSIQQFVSAHDDIGIPMNQSQSQMKLHRSTCAPGLGTKN
jgi:hypothetical protein